MYRRGSDKFEYQKLIVLSTYIQCICNSKNVLCTGIVYIHMTPAMNETMNETYIHMNVIYPYDTYAILMQSKKAHAVVLQNQVNHLLIMQHRAM